MLIEKLAEKYGIQKISKEFQIIIVNTEEIVQINGRNIILVSDILYTLLNSSNCDAYKLVGVTFFL